ncbi:Gmad2 immunoglobulin-like domain-containing protein [Nocardioides pantholopis]|uniref:Gmad2 immunoglobulin-like domain-containing protein n=1 Tax=Nocardioides pantholopis TaxID=2483798 RepID=UPI000F073D8A|nr:Gmad2 immunoglobulin-like domain-containing protein [Nocardioides pantholopis]
MSSSPRFRTAVLAATAALSLAALTGCGEDEPSRAQDPASPETSATPSASTSPSDPASSSPSSPAPSASESGEQVTVPVYFVGDTPQGPRLFREFRKVAAADPLAAAAALVTSGAALDPDYRTAYPTGSFASIEFTGEAFRVTLPDDSWTTPAGLDSSEEGPLAVQQLVYTLQGVQQKRVPVQVFVGDTPAALFGVDTAGSGVTAGDQLDTLALVSITAPEEGATVSGSFTASGVANSPEANVPWEIRQGKKVVKKGFATADGWMDKLYPWQTQVDVAGLAPGEYTFVARTDDQSGGEGFGPTEDTRTITVK